jgi:release factor glutamine methyltransferase
MQIRDALAWAAGRLEREPVGSPRLAAEALLLHILGRDRAFLHAHPEQGLSASQQSRYREAVELRASGLPLQYITGHQEFWGLDLAVTPAVLIPRPETEHLVEAALDLLRRERMSHPRIVDVGTGSGCIILALASALAEAELHATEISPAALEVARSNALRLGLDQRVTFHPADLLDCFPEQRRFDLIVSNPPYVGYQERDKVQREVRDHEPEVAVFAGDDGLAVYRRLIPAAARLLAPGGALLMEIGYSIGNPVRGLLAGWEDVQLLPDLQGIPRVVVARCAPERVVSGAGLG